jgi:hypothetical protein
MPNRVTHFEIPSDDPQTTMDFFSTVFGWKFQQFGNQSYWIALAGDEKEPGINGAIMKRVGEGQPVVTSIQVESLEATLRKLGQAGGTVVVPKMAVPSVGWLAYFKDPDGNIHGAWQPDPNAK